MMLTVHRPNLANNMDDGVGENKIEGVKLEIGERMV